MARTIQTDRGHYVPWELELTDAQVEQLKAMGLTPQQVFDSALAERAQPSDERLWEAYLIAIRPALRADGYDVSHEVARDAYCRAGEALFQFDRLTQEDSEASDG